MDDIEKIRRLIFEYCYATDSGDKEAWVSTFTEDVIWDGPFGSFVGRDGGRAFLGDSDTSGMRHLTMNSVIDVDGDNATGRSYIVVMVAGEAPTAIFAGVYQDRYVRQNGRWLIAERHLLPGPAALKSVQNEVAAV
jgi:ketosteroid isomerase-like protein